MHQFCQAHQAVLFPVCSLFVGFSSINCTMTLHGQAAQRSGVLGLFHLSTRKYGLPVFGAFVAYLCNAADGKVISLSLPSLPLSMGCCRKLLAFADCANCTTAMASGLLGAGPFIISVGISRCQRLPLPVSVLCLAGYGCCCYFPPSVLSMLNRAFSLSLSLAL